MRFGVALFGFAITLLGFFTLRATSFPPLLSIVAPDYVAQQHGMQRLDRNEELLAEDADFAALWRLVVVSRPDRPEFASLHPTRMKSANRLIFKPGRDQSDWIQVFIREWPDPGQVDLVPLTKLSEQYVNRRTLGWGLSLFVFGSFCSLFMIFSTYAKDRAAKRKGDTP
jgi:hypothetical protein